MKGLNRLELKARNFKHSDGLGIRVLDQRNRRRTDIASHHGGKAAGRDHFARQRGGGGLPVRAGDGNNASRQELRGQFNFSDDGFTEGSRLSQHGGVEGHTRAHHNQVLTLECPVAVTASLDDNALVEQPRNFLSQLFLGLGVRNSHTRPVGLQKQCRSHAGLA